jgi:hypothetical protein
MLTNVTTTQGSQALAALIEAGTLAAQSAVAFPNGRMATGADVFVLHASPAAPALPTPADASRWFMAAGADAAAPSAPRAGGNGIAGAGDGSSDGGNGGRKKGRDLLEQILAPSSSLSGKEHAAHIAFALARVDVTENDLRSFLAEHMTEERLAPIRHQLLPDLLTDDEAIDTALTEVSAGNISPQTLTKLRQRNTQPVSGAMKKKNSNLFEIPYADAGPITRNLMERFALATAPLECSYSSRAAAFHVGYRSDDYDKEQKKKAYQERKTARLPVAAVMAALDKQRAVDFFDFLFNEHMSIRLKYLDTGSWRREIQDASRAALIRIGGRQLVDRLEPFMMQLFADGGDHLLQDGSAREMFEPIGIALLKAVAAGESSRADVRERINLVIQQALCLHDTRGKKVDVLNGSFHPEDDFVHIADIGIWAVEPYATAVDTMLRADDDWNRRTKMTLLSLMKGMVRASEHLSHARDEGISFEQSVRTLLKTALAVFPAIRNIHAEHESSYAQKDWIESMRRSVEQIFHTLIASYPSETLAALEANPAQRAMFESWREVLYARLAVHEHAPFNAWATVQHLVPADKP